MAAPPNLMAALDKLVDTVYMDIRPQGRHCRSVHYFVSSREKNDVKTLKFKAVADLDKDQIEVENVSEQLMFTCYGGLGRAEDAMSVYSALNYFRSPILKICGNKLLDETEKDPTLQLTLTKHPIPNAFIITFVGEKVQRRGSLVIDITHQRRLSSVAVNFRQTSPSRWTPLKTALVLMAALKLMHYQYSFHLHLMPSDIPYLMPPGTPKEPLSMLESVREIVMRPSCSIEGERIIYGDLLDGKTLATLMVIEYNHEIDDNIIEICIKDQFGLLQFAAVFEKTDRSLQVYDHKDSLFGRYDGDPRNHKVFDEEVMFLSGNEPIKSDQEPDTKAYGIHSLDNPEKHLVAFFYSMSEWQVVRISMDPEIPVHWKAVVLAHAAIFSQLYFKFSRDRPKLFVPDYFFREISE